MKKYALCLALLLGWGCVEAVRADTSLTAYASYWDGDKDDGAGAGLRLKQTFWGFGSVEMKGGYIVFDNPQDSEVIPLEVAASVRLPLFISPYVGVGAGYYLTTDVPGISDDVTGYFVHAGVEFTLWVVGAMAEVRWQEIEEEYLDGMSANVGILIKW